MRLAPARARLLGALSEVLEESRLVTLVGSSGVGKTLVAREFLRRASWMGAVAWCSLTGIEDVDVAELSLLSAVTDGAAPFSASSTRSALLRAVSARGRLLLIVDGCEDIAGWLCRLAPSMLSAAPHLYILSTAKTPLGIFGEFVLEVPAGTSADEDLDLFVDAMRLSTPDFSPNPQERERIRQAVAPLSGNPLAIEIAAAAFGIDAPPPRGAERGDPIARALGRLHPRERSLLAQCSVFRGPFSLEALASVVRLQDAFGVQSATVAASGLLAHGLLRPADDGHLLMLDGLRDAAEELCDSRRGAQLRHTAFFTTFAERYTVGDAQGDPLAASVLARSQLDIEAALFAAHEDERASAVLVLCLAVDLARRGAGLTPLELHTLDQALKRNPAEARRVGKALKVRAASLRAQGKLEEARRDAQTALLLARELGDRSEESDLLVAMGSTLFQLGELQPALVSLLEALEICDELALRGRRASVLQQIGAVHQTLGDRVSAKSFYDEALETAELAEDHHGQMRALAGLGSYCLEYSDADSSETYYRRSLALAEQLGQPRMRRIVLGYLGILRFDSGRPDEALLLLSRACDESQRAGDVRVEGVFRGVRAGLLASLDLDDEARRDLELALELLHENPFFREVAQIYDGHLQLLAARRASSEPMLARSHVRLARARIRRATSAAAGAPLISRSDDARIATRILKRAIERHEEDPTGLRSPKPS